MPDPGYLRAVALDVYDPELGWTLGRPRRRRGRWPGRRPGPPARGRAAAGGRRRRSRCWGTTTGSCRSSPRPVGVGIEDAGDWRSTPPRRRSSAGGRHAPPRASPTRRPAIEPRPTPRAAGRGRPGVAPAGRRRHWPIRRCSTPSVTDLVRAVTAGRRHPGGARAGDLRLHDRPGQRLGVQPAPPIPAPPATTSPTSCRTGAATASSTPARWRPWSARPGCPPAWCWATRPASSSPTAAGWSPATTRTPGWRSTSTASAGCPTTRRRSTATARSTLPWAPRPPDQEVDPRTDLPTAPLPAPAPIAPPVDAGAGDAAAAAAGADGPVDWHRHGAGRGGRACWPAAALVAAPGRRPRAAAAPAAGRGQRGRRLGRARRHRPGPGAAVGPVADAAAGRRPAGRGPARVGAGRPGRRTAPARPRRRAPARRSTGWRGRRRRPATPGRAAARGRRSWRPALHTARRGLLAAAEPRTRLRALLWPARCRPAGRAARRAGWPAGRVPRRRLRRPAPRRPDRPRTRGPTGARDDGSRRPRGDGGCREPVGLLVVAAAEALLEPVLQRLAPGLARRGRGRRHRAPRPPRRSAWSGAPVADR